MEAICLVELEQEQEQARRGQQQQAGARPPPSRQPRFDGKAKAYLMRQIGKLFPMIKMRLAAVQHFDDSTALRRAAELGLLTGLPPVLNSRWGLQQLQLYYNTYTR